MFYTLHPPKLQSEYWNVQSVDRALLTTINNLFSNRLPHVVLSRNYTDMYTTHHKQHHNIIFLQYSFNNAQHNPPTHRLTSSPTLSPMSAPAYDSLMTPTDPPTHNQPTHSLINHLLPITGPPTHPPTSHPPINRHRTYELKVRAVNRLGEGPNSESVTVYTAEGGLFSFSLWFFFCFFYCNFCCYFCVFEKRFFSLIHIAISYSNRRLSNTLIEFEPDLTSYPQQ